VVQHESVDAELAGFLVEFEVEAVGEEGLDHEADLVFGGFSFNGCAQGIALAGPGGELLVDELGLGAVGDLIGEEKLADERAGRDDGAALVAVVVGGVEVEVARLVVVG